MCLDCDDFCFIQEDEVILCAECNSVVFSDPNFEEVDEDRLANLEGWLVAVKSSKKILDKKYDDRYGNCRNCGEWCPRDSDRYRVVAEIF
jgi:hypothetical protein